MLEHNTKMRCLQAYTFDIQPWTSDQLGVLPSIQVKTPLSEKPFQLAMARRPKNKAAFDYKVNFATLKTLAD